MFPDSRAPPLPPHIAGDVSQALEVGIRRVVSWVKANLHRLGNTNRLTGIQPSEIQVRAT